MLDCPYIKTANVFNSAHAVVETVLGEVSVRWSDRYDKKRLFVQIPFGAEEIGRAHV